MPYVFFSSGSDSYYSDGGSSLCDAQPPPPPSPSSPGPPHRPHKSPLPPFDAPPKQQRALKWGTSFTDWGSASGRQVGRPGEVHFGGDGDLVGGAAGHPPARAGHYPGHLPFVPCRPHHLHPGGHNLPVPELGDYELFLHVAREH